jgi:hypothetical protein
MSELTLLLPDATRLREAMGPGVLDAWKVRGNRLANIAPGRDAALHSCFEFTGTTVPFAALTRSVDAGDAAGALWLRADPAWVMADAVTLRLMRCGNVDLLPEESDALVRTLKPLFGDAGFPLEPATAARWYLRGPPGAQLPTFSSPDAALGDDVGRYLPQGDSARQWRHLLNEAQVVLHNHPVNAARAARGAIPVNSVWIWGGGRLPDWVRTRHTRIASTDDVVRALARLSGTPTSDLVPAAIDEVGEEANVLLDLAALRDMRALGQWLDLVDTRLVGKKIGWIRLQFAGGERYLYRRTHRWRFWRRVPSPGAT